MSKLKFFAVTAIAVLTAFVTSAEEAFYKACKGVKVEVVEHAFVTPFGPGSAQATLKIKNAGDQALRGSFAIVYPDMENKVIASAEIDMPPKSVSVAESELIVKAAIDKKDVGRKIQLVLNVANRKPVICYQGVVAEKAGSAPVLGDGGFAPLEQNVMHPVKFMQHLTVAEGEKIFDFVNNGGVVIVDNIKTNDDYAGAVAFVDESELPMFFVKKGFVVDYGANIEIRNPLLDWPRNISRRLPLIEDRLMLDTKAQKSAWNRIHDRNGKEGVTMAHFCGKGALILSMYDFTPLKDEIVNNIQANFKLKEKGISMMFMKDEFHDAESYMQDRIKEPTMFGGHTELAFKLVHPAATGYVYTAKEVFKDKSGKTRSFMARVPQQKLNGDVKFKIDVPYVELSGEVERTISVFDWNSGKEFFAVTDNVVFPEPFEVIPPAYRKTVSTKRAQAGVTVGVRMNYPSVELCDAEWTIAAKDAKGAVVATSKGTFPCGARKAEGVLDIPAAAPAGTYTLEAELVTKLDTYRAKDELIIVAPEKGQIIVDQDGFLLRNGEFYFPLGTYHCHNWNLTRPIDDKGLTAADMGFNWMQIWHWDYNHGYSLKRKDILTNKYQFLDADGKPLEGDALEAKIAQVIETNKMHRAIIEKCGISLILEGFGIYEQCFLQNVGREGKRRYETEADIPPTIKELGEDPDQLINGWYLADEAGGNFYDALKKATEFFRRHDPKYHPTFNLGHIAAVFSGDYGGKDIYRRYYGGLGEARGFADGVASLEKEYLPYHRRPFIVPQAFGQSEKQNTEEPEWVRMEAYTSIIHGAMGLGFYCWEQTGDWKGTKKQGMGWNPPTAYLVKDVIAEIKTFAPALRENRANYVSEDGNVRALTCGDDTTGRFLIVASTWEGDVETVVRIPGLDTSKLEPLFGAPTANAVGKDGLAIKLPKWGTAVWRVK